MFLPIGTPRRALFVTQSLLLEYFKKAVLYIFPTRNHGASATGAFWFTLYVRFYVSQQGCALLCFIPFTPQQCANSHNVYFIYLFFLRYHIMPMFTRHFFQTSILLIFTYTTAATTALLRAETQKHWSRRQTSLSHRHFNDYTLFTRRAYHEPAVAMEAIPYPTERVNITLRVAARWLPEPLFQKDEPTPSDQLTWHRASGKHARIFRHAVLLL